jgi:hypothetical protein
MPSYYYVLRVTRNYCFRYDYGVLAESDAVRVLSRVLFGQAHRLSVMVGIARGGREFALSDLAADLGFENLSSIQDPIRDLEAADLITRVPKVANRVRFRRNKSLAWKWAEELASRLSEQPGYGSRARRAPPPPPPVAGPDHK